MRVMIVPVFTKLLRLSTKHSMKNTGSTICQTLRAWEMLTKKTPKTQAIIPALVLLM